MQAIHTTFFGPTQGKNARLRAKCAAKRKFYPWDTSKNISDNHAAAALRMLKALEWDHSELEMTSGCLDDGSYVHTIAYTKNPYNTMRVGTE
jgi:hypothetical protein